MSLKTRKPPRSHIASSVLSMMCAAVTSTDLIRRGLVRLEIPLKDGHLHHLATFGRGDFFGETSFLNRNERSANATAFTQTGLYVLPRHCFDKITDEHKRFALTLLTAIAQALSSRLRYANAELRMLRDLVTE